MATQSYKLGPGSLSLGAGPLAVEGQFSNVAVQAAENVKTTDDIDLLDGTTLDGDENASYAFTLTGTLVQDLAAAGVIAWSWTNKGTEQPFEFIPNTAEGRTVTGTVIPVPVTIGGDAKVTQTSQITWRIKGDPDFDDVA